MAGQTIKGITIELAGSTTKLGKALKEVESYSKDLEKQLKEVETALKLDPDNTELLAQKQRILAEQVETTRKKLELLKKAQDEAAKSVDNFDAWQEAYKPIQEQLDKTKKKITELQAEQMKLERAGEVDTEPYRELSEQIDSLKGDLKDLHKQSEAVTEQFGNPISTKEFEKLQTEVAVTESKLDSLERSAKTNFSKIESATDEARLSLQKLGDAAEKVKTKADGIADAFQPVTNVVAGLGAAAVATVPATEELREDLSRLDANARENAVGIDAARQAWKEFAVQSGETDSAVEAVSNLLQAGFTESNLQKAVEGLAGAAQRFPDTLKVESLADSLQETLASGEATGQFSELLSRLGMDAAAFNEEMAACATAAEKQNLVLQTLANAGLNQSYEAWKANNEEMLANKDANLELEMSMAQLAEIVLPYVTEFTKILSGMITKFTKLPASAQGAIAGLALFAGAISPVANGVSDVCSLVGFLSDRDLPKLTSAFRTLTGSVLPGVQSVFSSVFGFIAANPVVLLIGAIVGMVALIGTKGDEIQAILQEVDDFLQGIFATDWTEIFGPVLGGVLNNFFETVKRIWDSVKLIFDGVIDFIRGVFTQDWDRAWRGVVNIFEGIFSGLSTILKAPINAVIGLINEAIGGINWLIDGVNKIPGVDLSRIGTIPLLASGGEVLRGSAIVGEAGPELLTVLGDRTVVQPLSHHTTHTTQMGGVNLHVYGAPGQNMRELAEIVLEELQGLYDSEEAGL